MLCLFAAPPWTKNTHAARSVLRPACLDFCVWPQYFIELKSLSANNMSLSDLYISQSTCSDDLWSSCRQKASWQHLSSLFLNLSLPGSRTVVLLCWGQVKGGMEAALAHCSQQAHSCFKLSWRASAIRHDGGSCVFTRPEWTWCQWKLLWA